jgi:hypothetical protein
MGSKAPDFQLVKRALSPARFESHRASNFDTDALIFQRYRWNVELSESLYGPLQVLEVLYRNAMDNAIRTKDKNWLLSIPGWLQQYGLESINEAHESLKERLSKPLTHDLIVQELGFGFWTSLLNSKYETLFHAIGSKVFPSMPSPQRKIASVRFENIRTIRNRIFHFRRIWNRPNLQQDYDNILGAIDWINADAGRILLDPDARANFAVILAKRP